MFLVWSAVKKQTLRETLIDIIDANTHALALRFTLEDLLEVTGIWFGLERPDHKYVNNFGLAWQATILPIENYTRWAGTGYHEEIGFYAFQTF